MEVKMVQCPFGHYYNAALHASCPECARNAAASGNAARGAAPGSGGGSGGGSADSRDPNIPEFARQDCLTCGGDGDCNRCGGYGYTYNDDIKSSCRSCHGSGDCSACGGSGKR